MKGVVTLSTARSLWRVEVLSHCEPRRYKVMAGAEVLTHACRYHSCLTSSTHVQSSERGVELEVYGFLELAMCFSLAVLTSSSIATV